MRFLLMAAGIVMLFGCTNAQVLKQGDGTYLAISHSKDDEKAYDSALKEADSFCSKRGGRVAILEVLPHDHAKKVPRGASDEEKHVILRRTRQTSSLREGGGFSNSKGIEIKFACE